MCEKIKEFKEKMKLTTQKCKCGKSDFKIEMSGANQYMVCSWCRNIYTIGYSMIGSLTFDYKMIEIDLETFFD